MSGLWELITRSHHPIVTAGLILILGIFLVNAALHSASFALRLVTVAIDELVTAVDHVRASGHEAMKAIHRLRDRFTVKKSQSLRHPDHTPSPHRSST